MSSDRDNDSSVQSALSSDVPTGVSPGRDAIEPASPAIAACAADAESSSPKVAASDEEKDADESSLLARGIDLIEPLTWPVRQIKSSSGALSSIDFRYVWIGSFITNVGSWMQTVAVGWLIVGELGGSPMWLGLTEMARGLPVLFLLPIMGVVADRMDRRRIILIANLGLAIMTMLLAVAYHEGWLRLWHLTAAAFLSGCAMSATLPAHQSLLPQIVAREHTSNAIALHSIQFNVSRIVGPALGGLLLAWGATWSFGFNAVSFLAVVIAMTMVRPLPALHADLSLRKGLGDGLTYLRSRADLPMMCALLFLNMFFAAPVLTMLPSLAKDVLHADERSYSIMLSCFGIGAVIAGMGMAMRSKRRPDPWRVFPFMMLTAVCSILVGLIHDRSIAMALIVLAGAGVVTTNVSVLTAIVSSTPEKVRGRVSSFAALSLSCGYPLGSLVAGFLAKGLGVAWAFVILGVAALLLVPLLRTWVRSHNITYQHETAHGTALKPA